MEQYRIVEYTRAWHEKLFLYMHKTFPTYSKEYIEYGIEKSSGIVPSLLVVNNKEEVVGCHLYYCFFSFRYPSQGARPTDTRKMDRASEDSTLPLPS